MLKRTTSIVLTIICLSFILPMAAQSQGSESFRMKLESVLHRFKNYRFSTVDIYALKDVKDVRNAIKELDQSKNKKKSAAKDGEDCTKGADPAALQMIKNNITSGKTKSQTQRDLMNKMGDVPEKFDCIYDQLAAAGVSVKLVRKVYVVTTRKETKDDLVPNTIIAMIVSLEDEDEVKKNVDMTAPKHIFTYPELVEFDLNPEEYRAENMYDLLLNAFRQNNVEKKTMEAQGIGTMLKLMPKQYGTTTSLVSKENDITPEDVQTFKRISEGQPMDYVKSHEVIVSPDLISWKRYEIQTIEYEDGYVDTLSMITNASLPKFGVELKYGIEGINYPSFWSERMTLSAMWNQMKLGVILPSRGWSNIQNELYDEEDRKFTHAGVGLAASLDFPIKVIPKSGVFHFDGSYVFGDAKDAEYKSRELAYGDVLGGSTKQLTKNGNNTYADYLVRFNAQLHYTFGLAIDKDYQMRFGIGATVYNMETWTHQAIETTKEVEYKKAENETIGGISGRFDFMMKNSTTPFGINAQYFDESIYTCAWVHFQVVENLFAVRLEGKGYFSAFRDKLRNWEQKSVVIPMARFIVTF